MNSNEDGTPELEGLDLDDPIELARLDGHLKLGETAWQFLNAAVRDGDLRTVWGLVDETFRKELATQWVIDNQRAILAGGFDESAVVDGLSAEPPTHELWPHFERVHVRGFRRVLPDSSVWGIGTNTRIIGPDLEALYVHDMSPPPGVSADTYPLVFRLSGDHWKLAMVGANKLINDD